jgi:hypothetical protein
LPNKAKLQSTKIDNIDFTTKKSEIFEPEVLMAVTTKNLNFCDVQPCILKKEARASSEIFARFHQDTRYHIIKRQNSSK